MWISFADPKIKRKKEGKLLLSLKPSKDSQLALHPNNYFPLL